VPLLFGIAGHTLGVSYPALDDAARAVVEDSSPLPPPPTGGYAPSWPFVLGACVCPVATPAPMPAAMHSVCRETPFRMTVLVNTWTPRALFAST